MWRFDLQQQPSSFDQLAEALLSVAGTEICSYQQIHRSNLGGGQKGLSLRYSSKRELVEHREANTHTTTQKKQLASSHLDQML